MTDDDKPRKRSEELAIENVKRIADLLRGERNDALALAQVKREENDRFRKLLKEARRLLEEARGAGTPGDLSQRIQAFVASLPADTAT